MKKVLNFTVIVTVALAFSCSSDNNDQQPPLDNLEPIEIVYGEPVTYEGETYKTIAIGTQTWFASNLNYNASGSKCYDNDPANCEIYGRLYDWKTALTVCPEGWHLPSNDEWNALKNYIQTNKNCTKCDAKHLKAINGWNYGGNGTDI